MRHPDVATTSDVAGLGAVWLRLRLDVTDTRVRRLGRAARPRRTRRAVDRIPADEDTVLLITPRMRSATTRGRPRSRAGSSRYLSRLQEMTERIFDQIFLRQERKTDTV